MTRDLFHLNQNVNNQLLKLLQAICLLGVLSTGFQSQLFASSDFESKVGLQSSFDFYVPSFLMFITVEINQAATQADPATSLPVVYEVLFVESGVNSDSFTPSDIVNNGTATIDAITITNPSGDIQNYVVTITATSGDGTIDLTIPPETVDCIFALNCNSAPSSSTDSAVVLETEAPDVVVEQASAQVDPALTFPVEFDIQFSEPINPSTFDLSDITFSGTATGVVWGLTNSGDDKDFTLSAVSIVGGGTLNPSIAAGVVEDLVANLNSASTSVDNEVIYVNKIDDIAFAGRTSVSIEINWTQPEQIGGVVLSYDVYYRLNGSGVWILFESTTELNSNIDGLIDDTEYEFSVVTNYDIASSGFGIDSTLIDGSIYLVETTAPDILFFDPVPYLAVNVGGATSSKVVAMENTTVVKLNGTVITTLNKHQTHAFTSAQFDMIESDKPIFVSGGRGTGVGPSGGNIVWSIPGWSGDLFFLNVDRSEPFRIAVWASEATDVFLDSNLEMTLAAESGSTFLIPADGSYEITSDKQVLVYIFGEGADGTRIEDPMPVFGAAKDLIGFSSRSVFLTSNSGVVVCVEADSNDCLSEIVVSGSGIPFISRNSAGYYREPAMRFKSTDPIYARSRADLNGNCGAPYIPRAFMRSQYAINTDSTYIAMASVDPCTVEILNTSGVVVETIVLSRSGSNSLAPYGGRSGTTGSATGTNTLEGHIVRAVNDGTGQPSCRFGMWYQPDLDDPDLPGASVDETIMFGTDDVIY